jgi:hypothetical protein
MTFVTSYIPILFVFIYLTVIFGAIYLIFKWVNKFISLKQEQNDLLREIIKKMDNK